VEDSSFIFWIIIFAVAVLQGIGQKKKKPGQKGGRVPGASRPKGAPRPVASTAGDGEETSEGMIPSNVWAEILGLARGDAPKPKEQISTPEEDSLVLADAPEREPRPERRETRPAPVSREFPVSHGADAVLHPTKPSKYESRLAGRGIPESVEKPVGRSGIKTRLFGSGSPRDLRKAVVLQEVLGPPVSMKEEG
jgi:hypothetical protein